MKRYIILSVVAVVAILSSTKSMYAMNAQLVAQHRTSIETQIRAATYEDLAKFIGPYGIGRAYLIAQISALTLQNLAADLATFNTNINGMASLLNVLRSGADLQTGKRHANLLKACLTCIYHNAPDIVVEEAWNIVGPRMCTCSCMTKCVAFVVVLVGLGLASTQNSNLQVVKTN